MNPKSQEFHNFVEFVKSQKEIGACTALEASIAILDKAQKIILSLKVPTPEEDNMYQATFIN
jgi:hypothetical protein